MPIDDIIKEMNSRAESMTAAFDIRMPEIDYEALHKSTPHYQNQASEFHRRLIEMINDFDKSLDNEHEVGIRLVSFGQTVIFSLESIGYYNPSLITFSGNAVDTGEPVQLIQHISQISILLMKLKRDTSQPKKPIGFHADGDEKESKND